jgi:hypothetical protein
MTLKGAGSLLRDLSVSCKCRQISWFEIRLRRGLIREFRFLGLFGFGRVAFDLAFVLCSGRRGARRFDYDARGQRRFWRNLIITSEVLLCGLEVASKLISSLCRSTDEAISTRWRVACQHIEIACNCTSGPLALRLLAAWLFDCTIALGECKVDSILGIAPLSECRTLPSSSCARGPPVKHAADVSAHVLVQSTIVGKNTTTEQLTPGYAVESIEAGLQDVNAVFQCDLEMELDCETCQN